MKKKYDNIYIIVWLLIGIGIGLFTGLFIFGVKYYKEGQIDAMKGKYKYEIIIKQDTTYKRISDE